MREIKFRAWDKTNRKMLPVLDINWVGESLSFITVWDDELNAGYTLDTHDNTFELIEFTGLKDKNGKEIYEGDRGRTNRGNVGTVSYSDSVGWHIQYKLENNPNINRLCPYDEDTKIQGLWELCFDKRFEVIGNTYEHSYLLDTKTEKL